MTTVDTNRELDAYLAEHLIGMRVERGMWVISGSASALFAPPPLSATGAGMLQVLEAMRERGWDIEIRVRPSFEWCVSMTRDVVEGEGWQVIKDTLPLAVATAAKAALEVEATR